MNITVLAKLTFFGIAYIYTAKLVDTLYHGIFRPAAVAGTVVGLNILAGLAQVLFFIALYRQFVPKDKPALRFATRLAIVGSAVGMLPKLLALARLFQPRQFLFFIRHGTQISVFCPWLAATLLLVFCLIFFFDFRFKPNRPIKRAFVAGAIGWLCMAAAHSLVIVNYLQAGQLVWLADLFTAGPIVFITATSISFLGLSIFFLSFTAVEL